MRGQGATLTENRINLQASSRHCRARNGIPAYRLAYNRRLSPVGSRHPAVGYEEIREERTDWANDHYDHDDHDPYCDDNAGKNAESAKEIEMLDAGAKSRARAFDATPRLKKDDVMTSGKHPVNEVGEHGHCGHDGADGSEHERNQWPTLGVVCHGWSLLVFPLSGRRPRCSFFGPQVSPDSQAVYSFGRGHKSVVERHGQQ